jgi:hypothetical protein
MMSSAANRTSGESVDVGGGYFTQAWLRALHTGYGDRFSAIGDDMFVSERQSFVRARAIMAVEFGVNQVPISRHLTGDFPLVKSQKERPVGEGVFLGAEVHPRELALAFWLTKRHGIATTVRVRIDSFRGETLHDVVIDDVVADGDGAFRGSVPFDARVVLSDPFSRQFWLRHRHVEFTWTLTLEDVHGTVLDVMTVPASLPA